MDIKNTPIQHLIVGVFSLGLASILRIFFEVPWSTSFGRVSFIILFLILIIGPIMRLNKPTKSLSSLTIPWNWRGELGIWFALTGLIHFIIVVIARPFSTLIKIGGGGFGLANLLGLIALFWALLLAITSFNKIILFINIKSWKWLHSLTYVVFYLVSGHFIYFQFFSTYGKVGPDWFGYAASLMAIIIIILQFVTFITTVMKNKK